MASSTHPLQEGPFDPLAMLQRSRIDGGDVRGIKLRMLWLRQREPAARVTTELVTLDDRVVVLAASVTLPDGGEGAGHAASRIDEATDLAATIETTELRAIGRALDILGYVVIEQPGEEEPTPAPARAQASPKAEEEAPAPQQERPRSQPPEHVQAIRAMRQREQRAAAAPAPEPETEDTDSANPEPPAPVDRPAPPQPAPERSQPQRVQEAASPPSDDSEPELEDVSWTAFWGWARSTYQLGSRVQLEELLGQPVGNKPPGELRRLLIAHFDEGNTAES